MASFTVAAFAAIVLMALGADISLAGEHRGPVSSIPMADMITAFRYVFGAAAALMACAALCMIAMEERPLAGPSRPVEMAELGSGPPFALSRHSGARRSLEPGIHTPSWWLWIPGSRSARPGMTGLVFDSNFKQLEACAHIPAARRRPSRAGSPSKSRGRRECRVLEPHP
jgi:hypothetical protein